MQKNRNKQSIMKSSRIIPLFILFALSFLVSQFFSSALLAAPGECPLTFDRTSPAAAKCDSENQDAAEKNGLGSGQFIALRDACENKSRIGGTGINVVFQGTVTTEVGNCSNAIASCFQHHQNIKDCSDASYLAVISACNNGNVGAEATSGGFTVLPGDKGCGTEGAAYTLQKLGGYNITTNADYAKKQSDALGEAECTEANGYKYSADILACKNNLKGVVDGCYGKVGGLTPGNQYGKVDESKLKQCIAESATNESQCKSRTSGAGVWANGKCSPSPADQDPCDAKYPTNMTAANPGNPTVDEAKQMTRVYELNLACKDGQNGKDCAATYTKNSDSGFTTKDELLEACNAGKNKNDASCLKNADGTACADKLDGGTGKCGQAKTNIISCDGEGATALGGVLRIAVIVLSVCVGIAAVGGIAWSSVQYASATDNQSNVSSARERIRNIIIGLLLYGFMVAIINWLVPGGVIG